jgi:hypothetical protein
MSIERKFTYDPGPGYTISGRGISTPVIVTQKLLEII